MLREQLELSKSKTEASESIADTSRLKEVFATKAAIFDEFDEVAIHNMVERIVVLNNKTIEIDYKCGFVLKEST